MAALEWLNRNAGAVQALGSIAAAIFTVVLIAVTVQYVGLTKKLADVAYAQSFVDLQLKFDYTFRLWFDHGTLMAQVDWVNRSASSIRVEEMFISAFYPMFVRPVPKRLSFFSRLVEPGQHFGWATELDAAFSPIIKQTEQDQASAANPGPNHYHFQVTLNFTDLRGAVQHCCFWTDIGTIHYQPSFYIPLNALGRWMESRRDAKERRRITGDN
jgi:hypothetical protein